MIEPGPLRDLIAFIARRPNLPPRYMALLLKQDEGELGVRLTVATRLGWLDEREACCGMQSRYSVTEAGLAILQTGVTGQVDGAALRMLRTRIV